MNVTGGLTIQNQKDGLSVTQNFVIPTGSNFNDEFENEESASAIAHQEMVLR